MAEQIAIRAGGLSHSFSMQDHFDFSSFLLMTKHSRNAFHSVNNVATIDLPSCVMSADEKMMSNRKASFWLSACLYSAYFYVIFDQFYLCKKYSGLPKPLSLCVYGLCTFFAKTRKKNHPCVFVYPEALSIAP